MRRILLPLVALLVAGASTFAVRGWLERGNPSGQAAQCRVEGAEGGAGGRGRVCPSAPSSRPTACAGRSGPTSPFPTAISCAAATTRPTWSARSCDGRSRPASRSARDSVVKPGDRGLSGRRARPRHAGDLGADRRGHGQCRPDLSRRPRRSDPDPVDRGRGRSRQARGASSETVLEDLRVIAMGRRLKAEGGEEAAGGRQARTATLEATPEVAEKIALVDELGKLSLSLRSLAVAGDCRGPPRQRARSPGTPMPARRCGPRTSPDRPWPWSAATSSRPISVRRGAGS